jgi:poly-gamma-glutamate synthesis protein (capsule biosynthesis protein)
MGIDAVNLANNHTYDYSKKGYDDTVAALENEKIKYFGNGEILIEEINGIKVGFIGILSAHRSSQVPEALDYLDKNGAEIKIVTFHWGNMSETSANDSQIEAGRLAIDCGADLVIGHHPHVLQGIEEYKGKYIVYSLGNFIFDGSVISDIENRTSVIFQQKFVLSGTKIIKSEINLIPILVTSSAQRNNFKPALAEDKQKEDILKKIGQR